MDHQKDVSHNTEEVNAPIALTPAWRRWLQAGLAAWKQLDWRPSQAATAMFCALLLLSVGYRLMLYHKLFLGTSKLMGFQASQHSFFAALAYIWDDLVLISLLSAIIWLSASLALVLLHDRVPAPLRWAGKAVYMMLLPCVIFVYVAHYELMSTMHTGLSYEVIIEGTSGQSIFSLLKLASPIQLVGMLVPIGFMSFFLFPFAFWRWRNWLAAICVAMICLCQLYHLQTPASMIPELRRNPILYALADILRSRNNERLSRMASRSGALGAKLLGGISSPPAPVAGTNPGAPNARSTPGQSRKPVDQRVYKTLSLAQLGSIQWVDPAFVDHPPAPYRAIHPRKPWNIVLFLLESTGFQYIFRSAQADKVPMPFVQSIAQQSWFLRNHFSPSNSSPRSVFAIMSGLFPVPQLYFFSMMKTNVTPPLSALLGPLYDSFLTNPSPLRWYFPHEFLKGSKSIELFGYHGLPLKKNGPGKAWARDEVETTSFFIKRMSRAKEPFFATMCSFVPHWPYSDYGPKYRLFPDRSSWLHRYYNNLYLLDRQIKRVHDALKAQGKLERTIIVMVGDHGEAFGQHPGNWTHSRRSFNENFQTPAIFYQPKLFKPRVIDWYTSHVDLVPTLLDAVGIPYEPKLLQGESLWQKELRRKYIFLYGNENTLSSISRDHIKVQISFKHRRCWAYDLKADPLEKKRLTCHRYKAQMNATLLYRDYQSKILFSYNRARQKKRDFNGATHPTP